MKNTIQDCYIDITGYKPSNLEMYYILEKIPGDIASLVKEWGPTDFEVKEKIYQWLETQKEKLWQWEYSFDEMVEKIKKEKAVFHYSLNNQQNIHIKKHDNDEKILVAWGKENAYLELGSLEKEKKEKLKSLKFKRMHDLICLLV
jgi:hypothetical protein